MELHLITLITGRTRKLDSSGIREISDPVFSPDGGWLAYTKYLSLELTAIFLIKLDPDKEGRHMRPGKPMPVTQPVRYDFAPNFDPEGHWLYAHPGVRLSAHVSWAMPGSVEFLMQHFGDNLRRYLEGKPLEGIVDVEEGY